MKNWDNEKNMFFEIMGIDPMTKVEGGYTIWELLHVSYKINAAYGETFSHYLKSYAPNTDGFYMLESLIANTKT